MKSFTNALKQSLKYGVYTNNDLENVIKFISENYNSILYNDDSGNPWIEFYSEKSGELSVIAHTVYKIAFIKSDITYDNLFFHIENVTCFDKKEWYIDDFLKFKTRFIYLHWDEPVEVVDTNGFSLLDMRFSTE